MKILIKEFYFLNFYLLFFNFYYLGSLNLSRSLGDFIYKQNTRLSPKNQMITAFPDCKVEDLTPDCDFIIIACDGIWDCIDNQEICDLVSKKLKENANIKLSKIIEEIFDTIIANDIEDGKYFFYFL
jgi:serine/threonine protein phosphatase PrpC